MGTPEFSLGVYIITVIGSMIGGGLAAYWGVKIAIAELKKDIKYIKDIQEDHAERILYLERKPK